MQNFSEIDTQSLISPTFIAELWQKQQRRKVLSLPILLLLASGLGYAGERWLEKREDFIRRAASASGEIVRYHTEDDESTMYYPVVQFRGPASETIEFRHSVGANYPIYRVGEPVKVLYLPESPKQAMIDSGDLWNRAGPAAVLAASALFFLITLLTWRSMRTNS